MLLGLLLTILAMGVMNSERFQRKKRELDPETFMNISEIIQYWNYPNEEYEILTEDGYYLILNRIRGGRDEENSGNTTSKPSVLLVPGILASGSCWIANLPSNSLGFILADAGFDVWLANSRGTRWCQRHQRFSPFQEEFWDFSFHEIAMYDLPATINFVLAKSGQGQLSYVCHSQGCTAAFIAFSAMPQLARKIKLLFAMGPVYLLTHSTHPAVKLSVVAKQLRKILGNKELCFMEGNKTQSFVAKLCEKRPLDRICALGLLSIGGLYRKNLNMSRAGFYTVQLPSCTSTKNLIHWSQIFVSEQFQQFDYGSQNIEKYNQSTPPLYKLEDMDVPTYIWTGARDRLATQKDTEELLSALQHLMYHEYIPFWMHLDYVIGLNAWEILYNQIVAVLQQST